MMSKQLKVILIGAGNRGCNYVRLAKENCPEKLDVVAIADPDLTRAGEIIEAYGVPEDKIFDDWRKILSLPKLADAAIIATQDNGHFEPAVAALKAGYDLLLEKPVAPTAEECLAISDLANSLGRQVLVCHVLRYTPFFKTLKHIIDSGRIGKVINIVHTECVGNIHQAHSYVRGNWRDSKESSPMILAKSCHDLDAIQGNYEYATDILRTVSNTLTELLEKAHDTAEPKAEYHYLLMEREEARAYAHIIEDYIRTINGNNKEFAKVVDTMFKEIRAEQGTA